MRKFLNIVKSSSLFIPFIVPLGLNSLAMATLFKDYTVETSHTLHTPFKEDYIIPVEEITFKKNLTNPAPDFSIQIFGEIQDQPTKGTIVFFHGGPGESFSIAGYEDFVKPLLTKGYRFTSVEIAGSANVSRRIDDYDLTAKPNYVVQTKDIMEYLKQRQAYKEQKWIGFSHSYGAFQLFNYLRYFGEESGFDHIISSGGVYNTGSWAYQMAKRWMEMSEPNKYIKSLWPISLFGVTTLNYKGYHSPCHMQRFYNPMVNHVLNQQLNPFFHANKFPKIPYLIQTVIDDHNVHGSQSIEFYNELKKNNHISTLSIMREGAHDLISKANPSKESIEAFLGTFLKFIEDPELLAHMNAEQSAILDHASFYEPLTSSQHYISKNYFPYRNWIADHNNQKDLLQGDPIIDGLEKIRASQPSTDARRGALYHFIFLLEEQFPKKDSPTFGELHYVLNTSDVQAFQELKDFFGERLDLKKNHPRLSALIEKIISNSGK